jgi:hypothetical protein
MIKAASIRRIMEFSCEAVRRGKADARRGRAAHPTRIPRMSRKIRRRADRRDKQAGKAILRLLGDQGQVIYPDGGARPMKVYLRRYTNKPGDGFGSHNNGRHKLG